MGLKGSSREFSASDIIQLIHYQKKTGRLTVRKRGRVWVLGFEKGMLVHATSEEKGKPRLGEILVRQGLIDRDTLVAALREQEKKYRPLGKVLEDMGKTTLQDIARALNFQMQETALNIFFHKDAEYVFERIPIPYDEEYITPINTEFLLMEGARRVDEWPAIRNVVGGGDTVFTKTDGGTRRNSGTPSHETVLQAIDGASTVEDLVNRLGLGLFETCRMISDLATDQVITAEVSGAAPLRDPVSGKPLETTPEEEDMVEAFDDAGALSLEDVAAEAMAEAAAVAQTARAVGRSRTWLWMSMALVLAALTVAAWMGLNGGLSSEMLIP